MADRVELYDLEGLYSFAETFLECSGEREPESMEVLVEYFLKVISIQLGVPVQNYQRLDFGKLLVEAPFFLVTCANDDGYSETRPFNEPRLVSGYIVGLLDGNSLEGETSALPELTGNRSWDQGLYLELTYSPQIGAANYTNSIFTPLPESKLFFPEISAN